MSNASYYRDTWVEINLDNIFHNVAAMKQHLPKNVGIIAIVKANAYGHGDEQVARTALEAGAETLAVAILDEALVLRRAGIDAPILVMGWTRPEDAWVAAQNDISLTVFQPGWIQTAAKGIRDGVHLKVHVKLDSGMGRVGLRTKEEADQLIQEMKEEEKIVPEGIFTHYATADEVETTYYEKQRNRFAEMLDWFKSEDVLPPVVHAENSAASLRFPNDAFQMVRYGISMYGLSPSPEIKSLLPFPLKAAFSLHSKLIHVKQIEAGESISYGATYTASEKEWIGTVPIGYADGWIRRLNRLEVLVDGKRAPVVGRICMDQMMVRLPERLPAGTQVTLIGVQGQEEVTADDAAEVLETINYEIPCMISERVPRVYKRHNEIVAIKNSILGDEDPPFRIK